MPTLRRLAIACLVGASACAVFPDGLSDRGDASIDHGLDSGLLDGGFPDAPSDASNEGDACGDIENDPKNCGACGHVCASTHTALARCVSGKCKPLCEAGFLDCSKNEDTSGDGCETPLAASTCGACYIKCNTGMSCQIDPTNAPKGACQCTSGGCGAKATGCTGTPAVCQCNFGDGGQESCRPGEVCGDSSCECTTGVACNASQVCCGSGGCVNLLDDKFNCGGCGARCEADLTCDGGSCHCAGNASCNNGSAGTCSGGKCVCSGVTCDYGRTCRANGKCG